MLVFHHVSFEPFRVQLVALHFGIFDEVIIAERSAQTFIYPSGCSRLITRLEYYTSYYVA